MWANGYSGYQPGGQYGQMPQVYGQMQGQTPQVQTIRDDRIWADGEDAARSYYVAAGCSATIWDLNKDTIYFKQTDFSGRPLPMMILDFTVRDQNQKPDYVTRQEFQQLVNAVFPQNQTLAQKAMQSLMQQAAQEPAQTNHDNTEVQNG